MISVVIVEDEVDLAEVLRDYLEGSGFRVVVAFDGRAGLALIDRERPALVLTDLMMPRMDGIEMIEAMRAEPALASIPVVLMSTVDRAGSDAFLKKPFLLEEPDALVERLVRTAR